MENEYDAAPAQSLSEFAPAELPHGLDDYRAFLEKSRPFLDHTAENYGYIVLYTDIVEFQSVNLLYGYAEGDRFLSAFANFWKNFPGVCCSHRVFADHFLCLIQVSSAPQGRTASTEQMCRLLKTFLQEQLPFHPNCRVHAACGLCSVSGAGLIAAISRANTARKYLKSHSKTTVVWFDAAFKQEIILKKDAASLAQAALREKRYCFYLQPKVNLQSGRIVGAEALARGIRTDGSLLYPDSFVPFLEHNGSIIEMDFLIFEKVCIYLSHRLKMQLPTVTISVNLSRLHTQRSGTAKALHTIAETYGIPPELLEFELTETLFLDEFKQAKRLIDELRSYGYKVSIDDFGSGYAGLNLWQELDFDILKLDKRFLSHDPFVKPRNDALLPNLIRTANQLQMEVLCEGAETKEECEYLKKMGCHIVQGYYFSKPLPCCAFDRLLEQSDGTFPVETSSAPTAGIPHDSLLTDILFRVVPGALAGFDTQSGRLLFASDSLQELTGLPSDALFSISGWEAWMQQFGEPNDFPVFLTAQQDYQSCGNVHFLFHLRCADGSTHFLEVYAGTASHPEWGRYTLFFFLNRDGFL
ncbi:MULTISPECIES: bifunctional diguanylate cyclase/phosphodiesterase [Caproicibacterium]|uniref:GGDEF domain-containing phosphodiesterase n=1 Tax=Caproicibacterium argilliputei TaxID=3030016 RepID=A0AA97D809_9FIRM|nr:GGDEF domain-containing phosphodiesterase [Caproicibacterium argilliputei]WOC31192.1 GGDEF domain-containing phosphodiesterase [Caproicibacterium argilliputei]